MTGLRAAIAVAAVGASLVVCPPARAGDTNPRPTVTAPIDTTGVDVHATRVDLAAVIAANRANLPEDSGSGRRIVYAMNTMHVWLVEDDESVARDYPVSGHVAVHEPAAGTYFVFSRSELAHAYFPLAETMQYMVRFTVGANGGNIGFHAIPRVFGHPVQTEAQLGTPLSSGCVRQADPDAFFLWTWAPVGTKVVVLH